MSEQTPPTEGQIHTPNPIEIFWEKNRKMILLTAVLLAAIVVGRWGLEEMARVKRNATWGAFAEKTGLSQVYAPEDARFPAKTMAMYKSLNLQPQQMNQLMSMLAGEVFSKQWGKVKGQLDDNLASLSEADIKSVITTYEGTPASWWAEWVLACKYRALGEHDKVESTLASLKKKAPQLEVFYKTAYPPVYVEDPKKDEDESEDGNKKKREEPKVLQAPDDSLADQLSKASEREATFRKANPDLYKPVEPEGRTVKFDTSEGTIEVRLYEKKAPKTCAQFLENVEKGLYKDLYFHEIWKKTDDGPQPNPSQIAFFGNPNAKDEDRTKWTDFKSEKTIPFESNGLSHFAYMLCAMRQDDRRDSDSRLIYFTGNDCAETRDGDYVVFGRVVNDAGKSLIDKIVTGPLQSTQEEEAGKGKPSEPILVKTVSLVK